MMWFLLCALVYSTTYAIQYSKDSDQAKAFVAATSFTIHLQYLK